MGDTIDRSYSNSEIDYSMRNRNVDWMTLPFVTLSYIVGILTVWGVLHMSRYFSAEDCWTVTNVLHGVISFILLHWIKGCPDDFNQGEFNALTLWEQIDSGIPWTNTKKFLILVPTIITYLACHTADYKPIYIVVNGGMFIILIVAKIPQMHRVRIFGINSTPGIDIPLGKTVNKEKKEKKVRKDQRKEN